MDAAEVLGYDDVGSVVMESCGAAGSCGLPRGAQHGEHQSLELLGLHARLGQEMGGAEGEMAALDGRELAA